VLQFWCCNFGAAISVLQFRCCNFGAAILVLQFWRYEFALNIRRLFGDLCESFPSSFERGPCFVAFGLLNPLLLVNPQPVHTANLRRGLSTSASLGSKSNLGNVDS
jgi:hypothetical protein